MWLCELFIKEHSDVGQSTSQQPLLGQESIGG